MYKQRVMAYLLLQIIVTGLDSKYIKYSATQKWNSEALNTIEAKLHGKEYDQL